MCSFDGAKNEDIQNDLHLTITHQPTVKQNGNGVLTLTLTNSSSTTRYKVILPGDGSENAWREPYVYFTADFKKRKSDKWEPLEYHKPLRCGNYDPNWHNDTTFIGPKQSMQIYQSLFWLDSYFNINSNGTLRLTAHYEFGNGKHSKAKSDSMKSVLPEIPDFTLVSDTIIVNVRKRH
jgi:hypothetical protein